MSELTFLLFIAGESNPNSIRALRNIKEKFHKFNLDYELITVDLLKNPHVAESARIVGTPMLMRTVPPLTRKFVGDFSNIECEVLIS